MAANSGLTGSVFQALLIAAGATVLWGLEDSPLPESSLGLDFLLWPVAIATGLSLAVDVLFRLQRASRLRAALGVPEEFRPTVVLSLLMVRRFFRYTSWSALLMGAVVALVGTQPEPRIYYTLTVSIGAVMVFMAAVRTAAIPFPVVGRIFGFPWCRLLVLGAISLLLQQQEWTTAYGFHWSPLLPATAAAMGASYLGSALRKIGRVSDRWANPDTPLWAVGVESVGAAAALATAAGGAFMVWGLLGSLPNMSAAALDQWPDLLMGNWFPLYASRLFEARHLVAGFFLALGFARILPPAAREAARTAYRPVLKAGAYALSAYAAWLVAAQLAYLGHGYALLGAAMAGGLFSAAAVVMVRSVVSRPGGVLADTARWLSQSTFRAFFLGTSLVLYGLLLRPLLYEALWFAAIYEWFVVLAFAFVPMNRLRKGLRAAIAPEAASPASWPGWYRHYQVSEERPDARMGELVALQQGFINTGQWESVWRYLVTLLLRNGTAIERIPAVFTPMRRCYLASVTPSLRWRSNRVRARDRGVALADTVARAEAALSLPSAHSGTVDEVRWREAATAFVEQGDGPEQLAVISTAASWERGADLGSASGLWFPLMTLVDSPVSGRGLLAYVRWVFWRLFGRGTPRWDRDRRQQLVDGAASQLFGERLRHESI